MLTAAYVGGLLSRQAHGTVNLNHGTITSCAATEQFEALITTPLQQGNGLYLLLICLPGTLSIVATIWPVMPDQRLLLLSPTSPTLTPPIS